MGRLEKAVETRSPGTRVYSPTPGSCLTGVAGATGSESSPFSPEPRNPLIPLKMMALGEFGVAVGKVDGVGETTADPLMVGVMASPGESGMPASSEGVGVAS